MTWRPVLLALVAASLLLAGCTADPKPAAPAVVAPANHMAIIGLVQDEAFKPIVGAHVTLRLQNRTATTDGTGGFRFDDLSVSAYLVDVNATGFENQTLTAEPRDSNSSVNFVLKQATSLRPRTEISHFKGILQCADEALILAGSCDLALQKVPGAPHLLNDTSTFDVGLGRRWRSIVVDTDFDATPGFPEMRLVVRGINDGDKLDSYQQYGRFNSSTSFSSRLDINGTYTDGTHAVPSNLTIIRLEVYPQGYGWHSTCESPLPEDPKDCTTGVGVGHDITFDLYVTVFYNQYAPDGYTLLSS